MMPTVATPRIQTPTSTAPTIRTTLRALLPPVGAVAGAGAVEVAPAVGVAAVDVPGATAAPHLLQNFVPGFRVAPQELQNAIVTSWPVVRGIDGASIPQIAGKSEFSGCRAGLNLKSLPRRPLRYTKEATAIHSFVTLRVLRGP